MENAEEPAEASTPPQAIVFFRDRLVELPDVTAPTLGELCDAFGLDFTPGTCIQERATGRVVATLPFEVLPALSNSTKSAQTESFSPAEAQKEAVGNEEEEGGRPEEERGDAETNEPVLFDLIVPAADETHNVDEDNEEDEDNPLKDVPEGFGEAAKRLVKLGAVGLLTEEADARADANPYVAEDAPGLLKRILYADEVYCPYRESRDPLHASRAVASKVANAHTREHPYGNERPYWATLDAYLLPTLPPENGEDGPSSPFFFGTVFTEEYRDLLFAGHERPQA